MHKNWFVRFYATLDLFLLKLKELNLDDYQFNGIITKNPNFNHKNMTSNIGDIQYFVLPQYYYVINDTGSTDDTVNVIKNFFDEKGIPGEVIIHELRTCTCHSGIFKKYDFFHFGWNRSFA